MKRSSFVIAFVLIALVLCAFASATAARSARHEPARQARLDAPIPTDRETIVGTLDNGMRYYIRENHEPPHRASLRLVVNAGSILEDDDQLGLAHFVEHMGFNGTKHFPKQDLVRYLESIGVNLGCGGVNAYTGFDETVYFMGVPTDSARIVENAFKILGDLAHGTSMEDAEVEKERGVITEEWRLWQGADYRLMDKHMPVLFKDSRYAVRLPIGTKESIATFKPDALRRFYRDWYRPDLMAVIAVGDFDAGAMQELIETYLGPVPRAENPRPRELFPVPDHSEMLFSIVSDPEETGTSVGVYFKTDPRPLATMGDYRRKLIMRLHDVMFQQRLMELSKKPDSPLLGARAVRGRLVRSKDTYYAGAWVKEDKVEEGLETVLTEIIRVEQNGFTAGELERAKYQGTRFGEWFDQRDKTWSDYYVGQCQSNFLKGDPLLNPRVERELYEKLASGITLDEVNAVLADWLARSSRAILVNAPEKEGLSLPSEESLRAVFARVDQKRASAIADDFTQRPLLEEKPHSGRIVEENKIGEIGVTEWRLSNGARVLLKPTHTDRDRIFFEAWSPGGSSLLSDADYLASEPVFWMIRNCGLGNLDRVTLKKKMLGTIAFADPQLGELYEVIGGKAYRKDLETMFQLIYLRFTAAPSCDEEFRSWLTSAHEGLKNKNADPRWAFQDTVNMVLYQNHPRRRPWTEEMLGSITLEKAMRVYRDRFADASGFTFVFTGDFDAKQLKPLVTTYIASLPSMNRAETWRDIGVRLPAGVVQKTVRRGIEPQGEVQIYFHGPFEWSRQNEWTLEAMGEIFGKKLREVVREDMSATYHIGAWASSDEYPVPQYRIGISFGCAPERVDEILKAVFTQIDSLKTAGPEERHVAAVKESNRRRFESLPTKSWYWEEKLLESSLRGEDPRNILSEPGCAVSFDARTIQDAAKKYFDMNNYVEVIRLPEKASNDEP